VLVLITISYQIIFAQIKYYTVTGKDSITDVATDHGLLILKRDSNQVLIYNSTVENSNKFYNRSLDNDNYLILGTNNTVDLFSLANKYYPNFIGSLNFTKIISIRPFGNYFAVIRGVQNYGNYEQYIVGAENDSIKVISSINVTSNSYSGNTAFCPEVVYPYLFSMKGSSIVIYKYNEINRRFELIDSLNIITKDYSFVQMNGGKDRLYIREAKYSLTNYYRYLINIKKYGIINDTLKLLSKTNSTGNYSFTDDIVCTDSLISANGTCYYLNGYTNGLNYLNNTFTRSPTEDVYPYLSCKRIYYVLYDYINKVYTFYYSKKIENNTIYSDQFVYNPTSVNDISAIKNIILYQNYPNPFNPDTKISFYLSKTIKIKLKIYDVLGREIRTLINRELNSGYYNFKFNSENLPSGIYFYRLISGTYILTKKMVVLK
ncbi:MAG: T9SS type A sorting domain-containing protein, partial [Ignavibacteriaceae bacterium]